MNVEDTALVLGLMANAGIKSSQSGTALRTLFTKLSEDIVITKANGEELVVQTQNADGTMRSLKDIIEDLRSAFNGMSESEKNAINDDLINSAKQLGVALTDDTGATKTTMQLYADVSEALNNASESMQGLTDAEKVQQAQAISSKFAMSGVLALINASEEDYNKLAKAVYNCNGAAEDMADTMIDNLKGDWTILKSQLEGVSIQLGDVMIPMFRDAIDTVSKWIDGFSKLDEGTQRNIVKFTLLAAALGPVLKIGGSLINVGSSAIKTFKNLGDAIHSAGGLTAAISKCTALLNPYTVVIGGVCAALIAWKFHSENVKKANEEMLESARAYTENAKALENLKDKYAEVNKMTDDDKEKKEKLREIQEQLIETYGIEAKNIDIVNGKYSEQIALLDELNAKNAKQSQIAFTNNLNELGKELDDIYNSRSFTLSGKNLRQGMYEDVNEFSNEWHKALTEISTEYQKIVKLDDYKVNGLSIIFNTRDAEQYKDVLSDIIINAQRLGLQNTELFAQLNTELSDLTSKMTEYEKAQKEAFTPRFNTILDEVKKNLGLQDVTEYTEEELEKIKYSYALAIRGADNDFQEFANGMLKILPKIGDVAKKEVSDNAKANAEALNDLEESIKSVSDATDNCNDVVKDFTSDLKTLDKAIEKVRNGGELSGEEIVALTDKYSELNVKIDESTGMRIIELSELEKLRGELPNLSKAQIETEKARTKATIEEAKKRMQVYMSEQQYLKGLVKYDSQSGGMDWGNIDANTRENIFRSNPEIRKQYEEALAESQKIQDMQNSLNDLEKSLNNIDTIYSTPGKEAKSGIDKKEDSPMEKALEEFEKSVKIRKTSLDEEMSYLEKIKDKYASTEEEKVDIDEKMYDNYLSIIERKKQLNRLSTDQEIKMYEEGLEKYSVTEYQKAEMSSKLLDTKVENAKAWIEQEKYYNRLSLEDEKAAYERIAAYENQSAEYKKQMAKEVYRVEKEMADKTAKLEKEKQEATKKAVEANIKAKEKEYEETVKLIEAERDKRVKAYQDQIDAMQEEYDKERELEKQKEYDEKIADLEDKMKNVRTQEEFEDLADQLNETRKDKQEHTREQQLKSDQKLLKDKIQSVEDEAKKSIEIEKEKLEAYKEQQNALIDASQSTELKITDILKEQLIERESLFAASMQRMIAMNQTLPTILGLGGSIAGVAASAVTGTALASAKNNISNISKSTNYNSRTTNNNTTNNNSTNNITNVIKQVMSESELMKLLTSGIQKQNRARGK